MNPERIRVRQPIGLGLRLGLVIKFWDFYSLFSKNLVDFYDMIKLALDFYDMIVDSGFALINYHLIEISSS